jgi:hypothetical protein
LLEKQPMSERVHATVSRDAAWIEREFGREKWPSVLARIRSLLDAGETSLARMLAAAGREEHGESAFDAMDVVLAGKRVAVPAVQAYSGFYTLVRNVLLEQCEALHPDLIVELGAGWGRNLVDLWLGGGPREARYAALELTASGREAARLLGGVEAGLRLEVHPFDYYAPEKTIIAPGERVLAFTVFSIDQIPALPAAAVEWMLRLGRDVAGVNFEPFGWQCRDELGCADLTGSSAAYAWRHDYNRDFWPVMLGLADKGSLQIARVRPELYGANPDNAASLLQWRKTSA